MFGHPSPSPFMSQSRKWSRYHRGIRTQVLLDVISSSDLKNVLAVMQEPFPALRRLRIRSEYDVQSPVVSNSFLGGSAPDLQYLDLTCVPFPGLPKWLLSATHLVTLHRLHLWHIPHSGYISPDAMITTPFRVDKARDILASIPIASSSP